MIKHISPYRRFLGAFIPNWLMERKEVSTGSKLCYARLAEHAGKSDRCYPSQDTLAGELGVSRRQVIRYTNELQTHKLIETESRGTGRSQMYYFCEHQWMSPYSDGSVTLEVTDVSHIKESVKASSEVDPNGSTSSSASEEEEDSSYMDRLPAFYKEVQSSPLFLSAVHAPGPYFSKLRATGDVPPIANLAACRRVGERLHAALAEGLEAQGRPVQPLTVPGPTLLPGLVLCWEPLKRYDLQPRWIRLALGIFCEADGGHPEVTAADVLERIAKRSDLFAEALRQQSEKLG